jgi:hypothetical protein
VHGVGVDELHRAGESRDLVGDPVLRALPALLGVPQQCRLDVELALLASHWLGATVLRQPVGESSGRVQT